MEAPKHANHSETPIEGMVRVTVEALDHQLLLVGRDTGLREAVCEKVALAVRRILFTELSS